MKTTGFGIVGTGSIADFHAQALADIDDARLVACHSRTHARAIAFARKWGGAAYETMDAFLAHEGLDVVIICTPSGAHLEPGLAALDSGRHLVVEKPLEVTPARCDTLIARAKEKGLALAGIFQSRFSDDVQRVKRAVEEGRFGRITLASASVKWFRSQEYYDQAGWRGTWALDGGGALMNQAIHAIDLLQWLVGDVAEVAAFTGTLSHVRIEVEDTAAVALRFGAGAVGSIMGTTGSWPGWAKRIEISGSEGSIALEDDSIRKWEFAKDVEGDAAIREAAATDPASAKGAGDPRAISSEGHRRQLSNFIEVIQGSAANLVDGSEARKAVAIIDAIYRSARSGKPEVPA